MEVKKFRQRKTHAGYISGGHTTVQVCFLLLQILTPSSATWWVLGTPSIFQSTLELTPTSYKDHCQRLYYLVEKQRELCGLSTNILSTVSLGARMGIEECQNQFRTYRWNCSTFDDDTASVFGGVLSVRSRERAYVYAVSAAGVAYAVTRACSKGEINECGCDGKIRQRPTRGWEWGGCSDDIYFGERFSKEFVDAREDPEHVEGLMNMHNNEAGRRAIRNQMQLVCKCHGVSGSCTVKVCWRKMSTFENVGKSLLERFDGASQVTFSNRSKKKKLRTVDKRAKRPTKKDLVFLDESPDYCHRNLSLGVLGTKGRACNRTSPGTDGCSLLCCGRGYQTLMQSVEDKCNCRFVWCCKVECDKCHQTRQMHYCN